MQAIANETNVVLKDLRARLNTEDPFFRDTTLNLYLRTGYIFTENPDGTRSQTWAGGSTLFYESGYLRDWLQIGATVLSAQPIFAPADEGGTLLLTNDQDQMTTLGLAYGRMRVLNQELTVGRQQIETPYVNPRDNRMVPITFEGVVLRPRHDMVETIDYMTGYLWRYKPRQSSVFESFSEGLGAEQDRGLLINGVKVGASEGLTFGAIDYWISDTLNTAYAEFDWLSPSSTHDLTYRFVLNYTDQRSVGKQLIKGAPYSTFQISGRIAVSLGALTLRTAFSTNSDDAPIRSPFGSPPGHTALNDFNFERAGEDAIVFGADYDLSVVVTDGLKVRIEYGQGKDAVDPATGLPLPDRSELDLSLRYRPTSGPLENFDLRLDYCTLVRHDGGTPRRRDPFVGVIFTYRVPLL
ncbi:MAG: OprD family porin [Hyphomicrobium sp.]|nr:OprD family porin [Hyphomicrobium sp.]